MEHLYYDGPEDIKTTVLGITRLACVVKFERYHYDNQFTARMEELATMDCRRQLERHVGKFIKFEIDKERDEVLGTIHLPYVKDEEIKNLETQLKRFASIIDSKRDIIEVQKN
jgi:hypothetical protein